MGSVPGWGTKIPPALEQLSPHPETAVAHTPQLERLRPAMKDPTGSNKGHMIDPKGHSIDPICHS